MLGVVLWSDPKENKAVIWCEDHGDLAFYRRAVDADALNVSLDAGDLVEFEMTTDRHLRYAHNPQLVSEAVYPHLAGRLSAAGMMTEPAEDRRTAQIIPFDAGLKAFAPRRRERQVFP